MEDLVIGVYEDFEKVDDLEDLSRVYTIVTTYPCVICGTAIGLHIAPQEMLDEFVTNFTKQDTQEHIKPRELGWTQEFEEPCYGYCDNPVCPNEYIFNWESIKDDIDAMVYANKAKQWEDMSIKEKEKALDKLSEEHDAEFKLK